MQDAVEQGTFDVGLARMGTLFDFDFDLERSLGEPCTGPSNLD